jgi:hypothetical protein
MTAAPATFVVTIGTLLSLLPLVVSGFLGAYVFGLNPRGNANRAFLVLMLAFVSWDGAEAVERSFAPGTPPETILPFAQVVWLGITLIPAALFHLGLSYPEASPWVRRPWALPLIYAPFVGWAYLILRTDLVIRGVSTNLLGPSAEVGTLYPLLAVLYSAWFYGGQLVFVRAWLHARHTELGRMQGTVVAGLLIASFLGAATEIFWPVLTPADTRLGLGSLYTLLWSVFIAVAIVRYRYLVIEAVTEPKAARAPRHRLERGLNYLVQENGRHAAMGAFRDIVSATPGLCVTGLQPARVAERFGLERTPILWITTTSNGDRTVRPSGLDFELVHTVLKFLRENPGTAVLLDDLDYLAALAGFDAVARVVKRVANAASSVKGTVILAAGEGTFAPDQFAVLRGCVDRVLEVQESPPRAASNGRDHALLTVSAHDAPLALPLVGVRRGLLLTTEHPSKARLRYGEGFDHVWITEHPESGMACVRPKALDTEARRAIANYAGGHPGADIVLVGLEQLTLYVDARAWLPFVKDAIDIAGLHGCRFTLTVSSEAISSRELAMLARRFDVPVPTLRGPLPGGRPTAAPENRIPSRGPVS